MVLTKRQIEQIKKIIEQYYHAFIFRNLGPEYLSEEERKKLPPNIPTTDHFKNAFIIGKTRGTTPGTDEYKTYNEFLNEIFNRQLGTTALDQQTIDFIKDRAVHYLTNLKNTTVEKIVGTIHDKNREEHMKTIGEVRTSLEDAVRESRSIQELSSELRDKTQQLARDWERVVRTELATAHNQGAINEIVSRNKEAGKDKEDILVYCQGPLDDATCKHCKEHYHEGGSFKIYRMSELLANGTNIGRKAANWQAVVPPMHPRCRHRLIELLPGWTLDENGSQIYVGPDHHELDNNKADLKKSVEEKLKSLKGKTPTFTGHKLHKRIKFQGMDISVENKKGSYRYWKDRNGNEGKNLMHADYGYIRRTLGNDGDHVDVFVGPNVNSDKVFIVHQVRPDTGEFDEDKVMLGFDTPKDAKETYLKHYSTPKFFGSMDKMDIEKFKEKVIGKKVDIIKSRLESISKNTGKRNV